MGWKQTIAKPKKISSFKLPWWGLCLLYEIVAACDRIKNELHTLVLPNPSSPELKKN